MDDSAEKAYDRKIDNER